MGEQGARARLVDARPRLAAEPRQQRAGGGEILRALREQADARGHLDLAGGRLQRAEEQAQERRLAGPVGSGDGDAIAAVEREVDVLQHAGAGAAEGRHAAAAVGGGVEAQPRRGGLARQLDPVSALSSRSRRCSRAFAFFATFLA